MTSRMNHKPTSKMVTWIPGPRMILMFAQSRALLNRQRNHFQKIKNKKQPKTKEDDLYDEVVAFLK